MVAKSKDTSNPAMSVPIESYLDVELSILKDCVMRNPEFLDSENVMEHMLFMECHRNKTREYVASSKSANSEALLFYLFLSFGRQTPVCFVRENVELPTARSRCLPPSVDALLEAVSPGTNHDHQERGFL